MLQTEASVIRPFACLLGSGLILAGCAGPYAEVSPRKPHLTGPSGSGPLASAEQILTNVMRHEKEQPPTALGECLEALQAVTAELNQNPGNEPAVRDYNFGISPAR